MPFLRQVRLFQELLRHFGLKWMVFRAKYEWRVRSGALKRKMPCRRWGEVPLSQFLKAPALSDPLAYLEYRQSKSPHFFFSHSDLPKFASILNQWDIRGASPVHRADRLLDGRLLYFSKTEKEVGFPPDWHRNAYTGQSGPKDLHWSEISDFGYGDI